MTDTRTFRDEIRETVSPWKYGGDKRAAMLWLISLDGGCDAETGDATDWFAWYGRIGRNILQCDSQGFVSAFRYRTEAEAISAFESIDADYCRDVPEW